MWIGTIVFGMIVLVGIILGLGLIILAYSGLACIADYGIYIRAIFYLTCICTRTLNTTVQAKLSSLQCYFYSNQHVVCYCFLTIQYYAYSHQFMHMCV
jgi:hypothetical protein